MALFGFGKKVTVPGQTQETPHTSAAGSAVESGVQVLGGGCAKCNQLEAAAREALEELHMDPTVGHIHDFAQIAAYGVMSTPALMVDGKVVSSGRVLSKDQVAQLIRQVRPAPEAQK